MNLFTFCFFTAAIGLNQCYHTNYQENYDLIYEFHNWTVQYNKTQYWNSNQNLTRIINNYADNKKYIEEHNSWNPTFTLELNQFADVHYEDWLYHKHFNEHMFIKDFNAPIEKEEVLPLDSRQPGEQKVHSSGKGRGEKNGCPFVAEQVKQPDCFREEVVRIPERNVKEVVS